MKKTILVLSLVFMISWQNLTTPRKYTIEIPETEINSYWSVIHGQQDNLTVGQYKSIMQTLESQVLTQSNKYHIEDSIAQSKIKKDTTAKK